MKLFKLDNGKEVSIGDPVRTFRGDLCKLVDFTSPIEPTQSGRVYVKFNNVDDPSCLFPSVIGCHIANGPLTFYKN